MQGENNLVIWGIKDFEIAQETEIKDILILQHSTYQVHLVTFKYLYNLKIKEVLTQICMKLKQLKSFFFIFHKSFIGGLKWSICFQNVYLMAGILRGNQMAKLINPSPSALWQSQSRKLWGQKIRFMTCCYKNIFFMHPMWFQFSPSPQWQIAV